MSNSSSEEATPKIPSPGPQSKEVLHQRRGLPSGRARLAVFGFAIVLTLSYFTLYSTEKPEASAIEVAQVGSGVGAGSQNTHPTK